jgi:two-component system chemotaxis response regulator CheY
MTVVEASEGLEALCKARETPFSVVITDMHMPVMDGISLVRELRKLPDYERVPVIIMTSDFSRHRIQEGKDAGANSWLVKPAKPDALLRTVHAALRRG